MTGRDLWQPETRMSATGGSQPPAIDTVIRLSELVEVFDRDQSVSLCRMLERIVGQLHARLKNDSLTNTGDLPEGGTLAGAAIPALPSARSLRRLIKHRHHRMDYLPNDLFSDPAWDMLLDLAAADVENRRISVTSLCIASGTAPSTALRWIGLLEQHKIVTRTPDTVDKRRIFVCLTDMARRAIACYFADVQASYASNSLIR